MKKLNLQKGFTIIETLVAITILMISLAGPLTVAHKGLLAAIYARDQVTASYLAQDAVEYLKNIRDNNVAKGAYWLAGMNADSVVCVQASPCKVDTLTGIPSLADTDPAAAGISQCTPGSSCNLYVVRTNCGSNICGYTPSTSAGGVNSQFTRYFYIVPRSGSFSSEVQMTVVVTWSNGLVNNEVVYENEFFNIIR